MGSRASASVSRPSLTARLARNCSSSADCTLLRAAKNVSWAARKRAQSASSSFRDARPADFQRSISRLYAAAVGPQSREVASASASFTSACLASLTSLCEVSSCAKCWRRCRSKVVRAWLKRCQSSSSGPRSSRGPSFCWVFHWSNSSRMRWPSARHWTRSGGRGRDALGLLDEGGPRAELLGPDGGLGRGRLGPLLAGPRGEGVDPGGERGQVSDRVGLGRDLAQLLDAGLDVARRHLGAVEPLREQADLRADVVVLAGEVGQRLGLAGAGIRAHRSLAVARAHVDGAVVTDPAEVVDLHRRHLLHTHFTVTEVMLTGVFGAPSLLRGAADRDVLHDAEAAGDRPKIE